MKAATRVIALLTGLLLSTHGAQGQTQFNFRSIRPDQAALGDLFGWTLMAADLDRDGFEDLIVCEQHDKVGTIHAGRVWIYRGPNFIDHWSFTAAEPIDDEQVGFRKGSVVDLDEDGWLDLIIVSPQLDWHTATWVGRVHAFYGPDFSTDVVFMPQVLQNQQFGTGHAVFRRPSGKRQLVIGSPGLVEYIIPVVGQGAAYVFDAETFQLEAQVFTPTPDPNPFVFAAFGNSFYTHDLTGDGVEDLLVAEPGAVLPGAVTTGLIHTYDGATSQWIPPIVAPQVSPLPAGFGSPIHHIGDFDGDGFDDMLVGAIGSTVEGVIIAGEALLLAGPDYTQVLKIFLPPLPWSGGKFGLVATALDFNRDGVLDVAVADPAQFGGGDRVYLWYGPDFEVRQDLGSEIPTAGFGRDLQPIDADGDGFDEFAISGDWGDGSGIVYIYDPITLAADATTISVSAGASIGFDLDLGRERSGEHYQAALSLSGDLPGTILGHGSYLPLNIDATSLIGLALTNSPLLPGFSGTLDAEGQASFAMLLPAGLPSWLVGRRLTVAAIVVEEHATFGAGSSRVQFDIVP